jgi:hypothetical protein
VFSGAGFCVVSILFLRLIRHASVNGSTLALFREHRGADEERVRI